jgi:hypothetical protein
MMLHVLREHQIYEKLSKFSFYYMYIHYLGQIILEDDIEVDLDMFNVIKEWLVPRIFIEVRSFMELARYYRKIIKGFSKIAHPINSLQNKGVKFEWTEKCEKVFLHLEESLTIALVIKIANPNDIL